MGQQQSSPGCLVWWWWGGEVAIYGLLSKLLRQIWSAFWRQWIWWSTALSFKRLLYLFEHIFYFIFCLICQNFLNTRSRRINYSVMYSYGMMQLNQILTRCTISMHAYVSTAVYALAYPKMIWCKNSFFDIIHSSMANGLVCVGLPTPKVFPSQI